MLTPLASAQDAKKGEHQDREARSDPQGVAGVDNFGMNLFVISTASGKGIVVDKASKKETYVKMVSGGVGLGLGATDFRVVFAFETKKALNDFINSGWDADAHAEASVAPGVWVYQLTETGLALQATLQGTKYYKDDSLN